MLSRHVEGEALTGAFGAAVLPPVLTAAPGFLRESTMSGVAAASVQLLFTGVHKVHATGYRVLAVY
jgi:hypothetical protein